MVRFVAKLAIRIASKPFRMAWAALGPAGSVAQPSPGAPPPPRRPEAPAAEASPFDVQLDPGVVLQRLAEGEVLRFIDVRQADELADSGMIEGALHIPTQDLPRRAEDLDRDAEYVLYCAAGVRSLDAAMFLREQGFQKVWSLGGGLPHWRSDGGGVVPFA